MCYINVYIIIYIYMYVIIDRGGEYVGILSLGILRNTKFSNLPPPVETQWDFTTFVPAPPPTEASRKRRRRRRGMRWRREIFFFGSEAQVVDACNTAVKHFKAGYSYIKACEGAWAVDISSGGQEHKRVLDFNNKICSSSGLPVSTSLKLASFGGSHSNYYLRCVDARLHVPQKTIAPSGYLDPEFLVSKHPQMESAIKRGLEWNVIASEVVEAFPDLIPLAQKALNTRGAGDVSEMEGLLTQFGAYEAMTARGEDKKRAIEAAIETSIQNEPFWAPWAKSLGKFVEKCNKAMLSECNDMRAAAFKATNVK